MNQTYDPLTSALTGHLPFHLLLAAALTWPVATALLSFYTRAVRRSMAGRATTSSHASPQLPSRTSTSGSAGTPVDARSAPPASALPAPALEAGAGGGNATLSEVAGNTGQVIAALESRLTGSLREAALVYVAAGTAYALVMATAQLLADDLEILPIRFLMFFLVFVWPLVPTVAIVGAATRTAKVTVASAYALAFVTTGALAISRTSAVTWSQVGTLWLIWNLPPTLLLVTYLSHGIRAVGPLVLIFLMLALVGSDVVVSLIGSDERYLRAVIDLTDVVGLGGVGTFAAMLFVGFLLFAAVGWLTLGWIRRGYLAKRISDESLTIDALWLLFTIVYSINMVFGGPAWMLAGLAAFVVFTIVSRLVFRVLRARTPAGTPHPSLLVLRSFSIGRDSERLFALVGHHWRRSGSIQMIAGIDFATMTIEPHEFLDFVSGKLSRRFIDSEKTLGLRLRERDLTADFDGRFRVNEFFCYDDTWKMVFTRLADHSDAVLMDLRGFSRQNTGCVFELHELARLVPLERVVFVVDERTDEALLADSVGRRARVFRTTRARSADVRPLMRALAAAVGATAAVPRDPAFSP